MSLWLVLAVNSITLGGLLFLLSAGFSLIFGLMRIPNLTHGSFFMLGAYVATSLIAHGLDFWTAALLARLLVAAFGGILERPLLTAPAPLRGRVRPGRVAGRVRRRHRRPDPVGLSGARPGDAAAGPRRGDPGRQRQPARLAGRQLRGRLPLQLRPGHVPRAGLRRAVPADAAGAGGASARSVRAAGGVRRLVLGVALVVLATVPLWLTSTYYVNISSQILFYAIFALAVNVLAGYAGLVSLGHAGLFGIAAYAAGKLLTGGHGHGLVVAAPLATTLVAAGGFARLGLRGTRAGVRWI